MTQGKKLSESTLQRIKKLVEEEEVGFIQIAERFRVSPGSVSAMTKKYGWKGKRKAHYSYPLSP